MPTRVLPEDEDSESASGSESGDPIDMAEAGGTKSARSVAPAVPGSRTAASDEYEIYGDIEEDGGGAETTSERAKLFDLWKDLQRHPYDAILVFWVGTHAAIAAIVVNQEQATKVWERAPDRIRTFKVLYPMIEWHLWFVWFCMDLISDVWLLFGTLIADEVALEQNGADTESLILISVLSAGADT